MRQGQPQNRQRSRGRGSNRNNNRNNLNRSMESNGPDVRIRGTASHIAEKYQQLARDAQSSGDSVAAESYWQHAEHYNRLIATAQAEQAKLREEQMARQAAEGGEDGGERSEGDEAPRGRGRRRGRRNEEERVASEGSAEQGDGDSAGDADVSGSGPQPDLSEVPAEVALQEKPVNGDGESAPRRSRNSRRPRREEDDVEVVASEPKSDLPAVISGGAED